MSLRMSTRSKAPVKRNAETSSTESPAEPTPKRAKAEPRLALDSTEYLLTRPRSKLCSMDIGTLFNANTWAMLSDGARDRLAPLLPPTSFQTYRPRVDPSHPCAPKPEIEDADSMEIDTDTLPPSSDLLVPGFMNCDYLQAAAKQYQDHIFSGFFTAKHTERLQIYKAALVDGTAHASWKDDEWEADHKSDGEEADPVPSTDKTKGKAKATPGRKPTQLASLSALAAHRILRPGDVIVYKRTFNNPRRVIQKHLLLQSIDTSTASLQLLLPWATIVSFNNDVLTFPTEVVSLIPSKSLTPSFSSSPVRAPRRSTSEDFDAFPGSPSARISNPPEYLSITISTSPSALESHILPLFTNINPQDIHQTELSSSKCFTVWRSLEDEMEGGNPEQTLGGRESIGTLYYLLQSCPN